MQKIFLYVMLIMFVISSAVASGEDDPLFTKFSAEKFEIKTTDDSPLFWDVDLMIGKDLNKIYLYSEGEGVNSKIEESENSLIFSRAITSLWDTQIGVAYDTKPSEEDFWLTVGLQGLAPYFFETRVNLLVNNEGNVGLRADIDYDLLLTQRLIVSPSFSTAVYTKNDEKMQKGSGLAETSLGLRLRYEIIREFAPYIGVTWDKTYGNTSDFEEMDETEFVVGVKFWF